QVNAAGSAGAVLKLRSSTVSYNTAAVGVGGIRVDDGATVELENTIVAGNTGTAASPEGTGNLTSLGWNVILDASGFIIGGDTTGNVIGQDPLLGPLADNG